VVEATDLPAPGDSTGDPFLDQVADAEPTPEFAAMVAEEYQRLLAKLESDELRRVALDRMEGYTTDEIAERLSVARRTVARRLDLIRRTWEDEGG
jgi:DNA-directed RNA polymerase specialized sigma24 family protein